MRFTSSRSRVEYQEIVVHLFVYFHNTCLIAASIAIVGRGEDGYYLLFMTPIITCHNKLMGPRYCFQPVLLDELI